jgi:hypothetical protein
LAGDQIKRRHSFGFVTSPKICEGELFDRFCGISPERGGTFQHVKVSEDPIDLKPFWITK